MYALPECHYTRSLHPRQSSIMTLTILPSLSSSHSIIQIEANQNPEYSLTLWSSIRIPSIIIILTTFSRPGTPLVHSLPHGAAARARVQLELRDHDFPCAYGHNGDRESVP